MGFAVTRSLLIAAAFAALAAPAHAQDAGNTQDAGDAQDAGDVKSGRELAVTHCSRCHVVGDFNPYGGIDSTPSFQLLARRDDWHERFQTFYERRPHPVFVRVPNVPRWTDIPANVAEFEVTPRNIVDLLAFVETLRPQPE